MVSVFGFPPSQMYTIGILTPKGDDVSRRGLWKAIRSWEWNSHKWDDCSYVKEIPQSSLSPLTRRVCSLDQGLHVAMLAAWSLIFCLKNDKQYTFTVYKPINTQFVVFCCSSPSGLAQVSHKSNSASGIFWWL